MVRRPNVTRSFVAGVLLIAPLAVTLYVLQLLAGWAIRLVNPVVRGTRLATYTANNELAAQVVAVVAILALVTLLGAAAQWSVGRRLFGSVGRVVNFIPLVDTVYGSVRQVATALVERETRYDRVVLVEYPREGVFSLGLVTGESPDVVEPVTGEPAYNVFLPNSPNPTGGRLLVVPDGQVHEIDMSARQGLHMLVTTGMGAEGDRETLDIVGSGGEVPEPG